MKKNLLLLSLSCIMALSSLFVNAQESEGKFCMVVREGNGKIEFNLYDDNNNISRKYEMTKPNDSILEPAYQYFYNYEDGMLSEYYYIQHKAMGEWTDARDKTVYIYNEAGLIEWEKNLHTGRNKEYKYDEQGRLASIKDTGRYGADTCKVYSLTVYAEYDSLNNPVRVEYNDSLYATSSYYTIYEYDTNGNVTQETSYKAADDAPKTRYINEYFPNGLVKSRTKYYGTADGFYEQTRETRTQKSGLKYQFDSFNYDESDKKWVIYQTYTENYNLLKGGYAPRNLTLEDVSSEDSPNSVLLTCDVPAIEIENAAYLIWCHGVLLDIVEAVDGVITYKGTNLSNGEYEFVVQMVDESSEMLYNVSNPVVASFVTELPPISNLRYVKTTVGQYIVEDTRVPSYWVHFEWDAPQTDLNVLRYNVYQEGWATPYTTTTNTCDSINVYRESDYNSADQQKEVGVKVTVEYQLGESEGIVEVFPVEQAGVGKIELVKSAYVAGTSLIVEPEAEVRIYNTAGIEVFYCKNQTCIDLAKLPAGVYIATVGVRGTTQNVKISR